MVINLKYTLIIFIILLNYVILQKDNLKFLQQSKYSEHNDIKVINNINKEKCNYENCNIGEGTCYNNNCICDLGYTSVNTDFINTKNKEEKFCSYQQSDTTVAFFLEFFLPFGVGHFYTGKIYLGLTKLALCFLFCLFWCGDLCNLRVNISTANNKYDRCFLFLITIDCIAFSLMHLIDLIFYGFGYYKDGNNVPLY